MAHIRTLLEERECLTAEYERDNEELRHELHQIKHQQGENSKLLMILAFLLPLSTHLEVLPFRKYYS